MSLKVTSREHLPDRFLWLELCWNSTVEAFDWVLEADNRIVLGHPFPAGTLCAPIEREIL